MLNRRDHELEDRLIAGRPETKGVRSPRTREIMDKLKTDATFNRVLRTTGTNLNRRQSIMRQFTLPRKAIILIVVVVLSGTAVGAYALIQNKKAQNAPDKTGQNQNINQKSAPLVNPPTPEDKALDPTASWQTYDNEKYSLKYPADWKHIPTKLHSTQPDEFTSPDYKEEQQQGPGLGGTILSSGTKLGVRVEQSRGSLEDYLTAVIIERRDITVDGQPAIQTDNKFENQFSTTTVFQKNGSSYTISRKYSESSKDKYANTYNKILESFKAK